MKELVLLTFRKFIVLHLVGENQSSKTSKMIDYTICMSEMVFFFVQNYILNHVL